MVFDYVLSVTAGEVFTYIGYVILAILALMLMIVIHEFGHFLAGRLLGFKIDEFAIGFGPAIFKKKSKKGTLFSLRILPIGGFCGFAGEDEENPDPQAFNNQKPWKRIIVLFSGAFFNFISSIIFIAIFFSAYGQYLPKVYDTDTTSVTMEQNVFQKDDVLLAVDGLLINVMTPEDVNKAFKRGKDTSKFRLFRNGKIVTVETGRKYYSPFKDGDIILEIGDKKLSNSEKILASDWVKFENEYSVGKTLTFKVQRGENKTFVTAKKVEVANKVGWYFYGYGITPGITQYKLNFFHACGRAFGFAFFVVIKIFEALGALIVGLFTGAGISGAGGTITVVKMMAEGTKTGGFSILLYFIAVISANLAVMNLLPLPALDGSRMVFCVIEWIRKKPLNRKIEAVIHTVGLILLLLVAILLDIFNLIGK